MVREIRAQAFRMLFVLFVFGGLAAWQLEFVIRSVEANVYLNLTIIFTFLFGAALAFRSVLSLRNETVALKALQVQYKDRWDLPEGCYDKPATVYQPPELLGPAHRMISEELSRSTSISIPATTVKMLVDGVEQRIDDRKSTLTYIVGLLVFLGLIGTFVGLMQTVGSVGDIIGSLNFGGDSGKSMDEAFSGLIGDLQGPLVGMATGFSSSLFGLLCSLTLGMMERFGTAAHRILPVEFESWLTTIAQLESAGPDVDLAPLAAAAETTDAATLERLAKLESRMGETAEMSRKTSQSVEELLVAVHAVAEGVARKPETAGFDALSDLAREMAHTQRGFMDQLNLIRELGESDREHAREAVAQISNGFADLSKEREIQREALMELRFAFEKITASQMVERQADTRSVSDATDSAGGLQHYVERLRGRFDAHAQRRTEKKLRVEYHAMIREVLEKSFRRDSDIAEELGAIRDAENRQDMTLEALVEHNRALQIQHQTLAGQVEALTQLIGDETRDQDVLDEVRRGRLGMDVALRQISSQLAHTREVLDVQRIVAEAEHEAEDLERKAG